MSIREFFAKFDHEAGKVTEGAKQAPHVTIDFLFGPTSYRFLRITAEEMLGEESPIGPAISVDARELAGKIKGGSVSFGYGTLTLAADINTFGRNAGHEIGIELATVMASLALAKACGVLEKEPEPLQPVQQPAAPQLPTPGEPGPEGLNPDALAESPAAEEPHPTPAAPEATPEPAPSEPAADAPATAAQDAP